MEILLCAIGKLKCKSTQSLCDEYTKRFPWKFSVKEIEAKSSNDASLQKNIESKLLLSAVPEGFIKIALDETGKNISSTEFAKTVLEWQNNGHSKIAFLIGGANGHADFLKQECDLLLSLGKMTWPHMLVRVMLAEQIYRVYTILNMHPYHKS